MRQLVILLTVFMIASGTTSKVETDHLSESNKDVFILAILIQDHLRKTDKRDFDLKELVRNDSLNRIGNSFEETDVTPRGGYISVRYKFSVLRDVSKIVLTDNEKERIRKMRWKAKSLDEGYDGEIRLEYPERFYFIKKLIVNGK
jgi:hypothetical protein